MKFIFQLILLTLMGCAPFPQVLEGTRLEICRSSSIGELGAKVKVVSVREKIKTCSYVDKVSVEKCSGFRGDKSSYIEKLRNQTGFYSGNILFLDQSPAPITKGDAYLCPQKVYEGI